MYIFFVELYDPKDVDVLVEDEVICEKFLRRSEACVENALDYAIQSFRWRKTFGVSGKYATCLSHLLYSLLTEISLNNAA